MRTNAARCDSAIAALREQLARWSPDTIVIVGDDQHENLLDDNMPPFSIFVGDEVDATRKYRYFGTETRGQVTRYKVNAPLAQELHRRPDGRGISIRHGRARRASRAGSAMPSGGCSNSWRPGNNAAIVPVMVNTYFPPAPSAARCVAFGRALGAAVRASGAARRVVLVGSGGLSHTKIDEGLDRDFIAALESNDLDFMASIGNETLTAGTSEIRNWMIVAGAAGAGGAMVDYVPCYRQANGVGCAMGFARWESRAA